MRAINEIYGLKFKTIGTTLHVYSTAGTLIASIDKPDDINSLKKQIESVYRQGTYDAGEVYMVKTLETKDIGTRDAIIKEINQLVAVDESSDNILNQIKSSIVIKN